MSKNKSELECEFEWLLRTDVAEGVPPPHRQYRFHPTRKWQADFAWPDQKVLLEIEGGTYGRPVMCHACGARVRARKKDGSIGAAMMTPGGSHSREPRFTQDCEKYNAAVLLGWAVVRVTGPMLREAPVQVIRFLVELLESRASNRTLGIGTMPDTPTERAACAGWLLQAGYRVESHELAPQLGMTTRGAYRLLMRLSRVLPITREGRTWHKMKGDW